LSTIRTYSDQTAWQIDEAVRQLIESAFDKATRILEMNRQLLEETAATLLAKETLTAEELPAVKAFETAETRPLHRVHAP
ncbi:MAG: cell division protein FtsH, partial [Gammaproteobacteria bacterium]|nr:cell division protein FtsH [Gammaproteobacteria bacterium]